MMKIEGGCYCGELRFSVAGEPVMKGMCHCRECQYISGGGPNYVMGMPDTDFRYTKGEPNLFKRDDLENPVTREFCGNCGSPMLSRAAGFPGVVLLKVGSFDAPEEAYGGPEFAIFTCDKPGFHHTPEGIPVFEQLPPAGG